MIEGRFAVCRVDLRGTGSSEGLATDEYPEAEQRDLGEVIAWLATQRWSNGRVGMFGTSYSGFNSIQMACERPPALHAICAIYATDDRYTDDVHYMGGALRAVDLVDYCHYMTSMNALPPVPAVHGPKWREDWRRRVEQGTPWLLQWLQEQRDGPTGATARCGRTTSASPARHRARRRLGRWLWRFEHDVLRRVTRAVVDHGTSYDGPHDVHVTEAYHGEVAVALQNPADASAAATCRFELAWPDVTCAVDAQPQIDSDATSFHVEIELDPTEDGQPFVSRRWSEVVPRDLL